MASDFIITCCIHLCNLILYIYLLLFIFDNIFILVKLNDHCNLLCLLYIIYIVGYYAITLN